MEGAPPAIRIPPASRAVDLGRAFVFERLVRELLVVVAEETAEPLAQLPGSPVAAQVHVLVLDGPPEPLQEDVVHPAPASGHTDLDPGIAQGVQEVVAGDLRARGSGRCVVIAAHIWSGRVTVMFRSR